MEQSSKERRGIPPPPPRAPAGTPSPSRAMGGVTRAELQTWSIVAAYLGAAVVANLVVGAYGPSALYISAFLLIPFDLCARDLLHERWEGRGLRWKMTALVFWGSLLSALAQPSASRVALASALSFALAG